MPPIAGSLIFEASLQPELVGVLDVNAPLDSDGNAGPPEDPAFALVRAIRAHLPLDRLAVFARVYETDAVVTHLPLLGKAAIVVSRADPGDGQAVRLAGTEVVLGLLGTDHVGYASFDLRPLRSVPTILALAQSLPPGTDPTQLRVDLSLEVLPYAAPLLTIDALADGSISHDTVVLEAQIDAAWLLDRERDIPLPSMQNPAIADWRLSPGSFATSSERLIGESGCEEFLPGDLSSQNYRFYRPVRHIEAKRVVRSPNIGEFERAAVAKSIRYGHLLDYRSQWFPIGHSLGKVLYSLPLAPGEKVNLAIIDWNRTDTGARDEATSLREELSSDFQRDRGVTEVVSGAVNEMQSGSSAMGTLSISTIIPDLPLVGSLGLGASSSDSQGMRSIGAQTAQNLNDGFQQQSTALRELRSTVVTQAAQAESGRFETRAITNYNHVHTLTILYYEVLRHFRTQTSFIGTRPAIFVTIDLNKTENDISESWALAHFGPLKAALLDPHYLRAFAALRRVEAARHRLAAAQARFAAAELGAIPGEDPALMQMIVLFTTGADGTDGSVRFDLVKRDGTRIGCRQVDPTTSGDPFSLNNPNTDDREENSVSAYVVRPDALVKRSEIAGFEVRHARKASHVVNNIADSWRLARMRVVGGFANAETEMLFDDAVDRTLMDSGTGQLSARPAGAGAAEVVGGPPHLADFADPVDIADADTLMKHLRDNAEHYRTAAWIGGDPVARAQDLARAAVGNAAIPLLDLIENRIVAQVGDEFAFPLTEAGDRIMRRLFELEKEDRPQSVGIVVEDLVSLPTRGVFAEGKLGHCSTGEKIDNTRFWDFQTSPLPGEAPAIEAIGTGSRFQAPTDRGATDLPASLLKLIDPPAAPDPTGLAKALEVLGKEGLFRDMSGQKELATTLAKAIEGTNNAIQPFADAQAKGGLLDKIEELDGLSDEDKKGLYELVLGGKGGAGGDDDGEGSGDGGSGDGDGSGGDGAASETADADQGAAGGGGGGAAEAPAPATAGRETSRPRKPQRPRRLVRPGSRVIQVAVQTGGVLFPGNLKGKMLVIPSSGQPVSTSPVGVTSEGVRIELPDLDPASGVVDVELSWEWRQDFEPGAGPVNADGRRAVAAGGSGSGHVNGSISTQIPFVFGNDGAVLFFVAKPQHFITTVEETTLQRALLAAKIEAGLNAEADFAILSAKASLAASIAGEAESTTGATYRYTISAVTGLTLQPAGGT